MLTTSRRSFIQQAAALGVVLFGVRSTSEAEARMCSFSKRREKQFQSIVSIIKKEQWRCSRDLTEPECQLLAGVLLDSTDPAETARQVLKEMGIDQHQPRVHDHYKLRC